MGLGDASVPRPDPDRGRPGGVAAADVGLAPTRRDPFTDFSLSTKIFEYAAMGKPVVASALPMVERTFPPGRSAATTGRRRRRWPAAILELVDDPAAREASVATTLRSSGSGPGSTRPRSTGRWSSGSSGRDVTARPAAARDRPAPPGGRSGGGLAILALPAHDARRAGRRGPSRRSITGRVREQRPARGGHRPGLRGACRSRCLRGSRLEVIGVDASSAASTSCLHGRSPIDDRRRRPPRSASSQAAFRIVATGAGAGTRGRDAIFVCVPTPITEAKDPDPRAACSSAGDHPHDLRTGQLIVLQSTTFPGTTTGPVPDRASRASGLQAGTTSTSRSRRSG
jgi:hypothetical protein